MTARSSEELAIYSGDIQDHIITLQHSLVYYERLLSDWNPTYTAQLSAEISIAKNKADVNLLYLTTVGVCCTTNLIMTGLFSMNINIPTNLHAPGHPFFWFIGIACMTVVVTCSLLLLVRRWWKQSKRLRFLG
jgi:magnesium transporter